MLKFSEILWLPSHVYILFCLVLSYLLPAIVSMCVNSGVMYFPTS